MSKVTQVSAVEKRFLEFNSQNIESIAQIISMRTFVDGVDSLYSYLGDTRLLYNSTALAILNKSKGISYPESIRVWVEEVEAHREEHEKICREVCAKIREKSNFDVLAEQDDDEYCTGYEDLTTINDLEWLNKYLEDSNSF